MRLASHITAQIRPAQKCKTCATLDALTDEDRADFTDALGKYPGSIIARALNARLIELGREDTVSEESVRRHIRDGHGS